MVQVQGYCEEAFQPLRKQLQDFLDEGEEIGASLCVIRDGHVLIDIWGGHADEARTKPWEKDTIINVWSTTKTVTALAALVLVDRGLLDVNEKVAKYWPEFAANGKQDIEVRHLLAHTAGLAAWSDHMEVADLFDADLAAARLGAQAALWEPRNRSGYHAQTYGYPIGELVKRVTGKTLRQFVAEELAAPMQADFQIGALEKDWSRVSDVFAAPDLIQSVPQSDSLLSKVMNNPLPGIKAAMTDAWRNADIGAVNGHGNARSVAHILAPLSQGGRSADGYKLLSKETVDLIFQEQSNDADLVLGAPLRFGIGFALAGSGETYVDNFLPQGRVCFWCGWGGSLGIVDTERNITIGYTMNRMSGDGIANKASKTYVRMLYKILRVPMADGS